MVKKKSKKKENKIPEKKIKLSGLSLPCPKCHSICYKQYHCKIPTYFCVKCNDIFTLKDEWVEQELTNTRKYHDIEKVIKHITG
jgi:acetyl-CoA carboxylase beta subunit